MESNFFLKNVNKIMSLMKIIPNDSYHHEGGVFSRVSLSFTIFYLTDFEYKINIDNPNYNDLLSHKCDTKQ
jgi:hypothetical protein